MALVKRALPALLLAALMLPASGSALRAAPDDPVSPGERFDRDMRHAQELFAQGLETVIGSVQGLLRALPRYEMPQIDEHGDIIIRRKPPSDPQPADPQPGGDAEPPHGRAI